MHSILQLTYIAEELLTQHVASDDLLKDVSDDRDWVIVFLLRCHLWVKRGCGHIPCGLEGAEVHHDVQKEHQQFCHRHFSCI